MPIKSLLEVQQARDEIHYIHSMVNYTKTNRWSTERKGGRGGGGGGSSVDENTGGCMGVGVGVPKTI